jgi:WD40 repeat protein
MDEIVHATLSKGGSVLATMTSDGRVRLWKGRAYEETLCIEGRVHEIRFGRSEETLVVRKAQAVKLFDTKAKTERTLFETKDGSITSVGVSLDGKVVAVGTSKSQIHFGSLEAVQSCDSVECSGPITCLAVTNDANMAIYRTYESAKSIDVWRRNSPTIQMLEIR